MEVCLKEGDDEGVMVVECIVCGVVGWVGGGVCV